ncbi:MAG: ATP-binding cassette domain-containing protein [Micromonosporaceae bacterium]|nr:ATP-binding cassette domain-containing protein [Micromonosporaceae bacterium]
MALPPHPDPGQPDSRSPGRYLWWLVTSQPWRVLRGALWGSLWMSGVVLEPFLIRGAIDDGLVAGDRGALAWWAAAMAAVGLATAGVGVLRHRTMTFVRMDAAYRTVQVVTRRVARLGAALPGRLATGEVVTVGTTDIQHVSRVLTMTGPGVGALVACGVVAVLVLAISPLLGALIVLGVPAVAVAVGPLLGRLRQAETEYRRQQGGLTDRASDIVTGLRVLRGIGGEELFAGRYRELSQALRVEGYRVGAVTSWVRALAVGVPTLFVALVTWLAARMVAQGSIAIGELVAVYAYAAVLAVPVAFILEAGHDLIRGLVSARRVVTLLNLRPDVDDRDGAGSGPDGPADLRDPGSGLTVPAGQFVAVASADLATVAALADRLGRYTDSDPEVTFGGVPLSRLALTEVRRRILVAEPDAQIFAGTLHDLLLPVHRVDETAIARCLRAASAEDIVDGLPDGLDTPIGTHARTLSGGQRQRVRLARALAADPEVLILLEPTSAVDAHTEAAITDRLRAVRSGRTTVVATTSPLLLDRAEQVAFLVGGRVAATGSHAELLAGCPDYRALVTRGTEPEAAPAAAGVQS